MVYDAARDRMVLFGWRQYVPYANPADVFPTGTWEWDGATWSLVANEAASPPARAAHALAYDSARHRTVLFGGTDFKGTILSDTWEWDGSHWQQMTAAGPTPDARLGHAMTYDSVRGQTVLFAGGGGDQTNHSLHALNDLWTWNGTAWTLQATAAAPPGRAWHTMGFDSKRGKVVAFGGFAPPIVEPAVGGLGDLWEWDGTTWSQQTATGPTPRFGSAMAYDSARGRMMLFSGTASPKWTDDLWEWDGNAWSTMTPAGKWYERPIARRNHAMAYDETRHQLVVFGGMVGYGPPGRLGAYEKYDTDNVWSLSFSQNRPPVIDPIPDRSLAPGETLSFFVTANDPDHDPMKFTANGLPPGANFAPPSVDWQHSGTFSWIPKEDQVGTHEVEFAVSDGTTTTTRSVKIVVGKNVPFTTLPTGAVHLSGTASIPTTVSGPTTVFHPEGPVANVLDGTTTVSCTANGDNPGTVSIACTLSIPNYRLQLSGPIIKGAYSVSASGNVAHDGTFYASWKTGDHYEGSLSGAIQSNAAGGHDLALTNLHAIWNNNLAQSHGGVGPMN